ncbi:MAG: SDR family NAD(P)-dependent oxidoreductase [Armatimonadota bacterium]|nr:SDR family NAD(P)-dependent oxidoreductase [Armatimonadota bacterium]MDR7404428.1 SDR family NAD(P)-dependent oxidoreductase [Armatimonadota bacterium]
MSGRVVLVTGASSGIGAATARAFGARGDRVVLVAQREDRLREVAAALPDALVVPADLTDPEVPARVVEASASRYGRLDVLVNNAGIGRYNWVDELDPQDVRDEVATNLVAPILMIRAAVPVMRRTGGVVINVSSVAGLLAVPTTSVYNATKFGLRGLTEALRRELGPQGIAVCGIYPSTVEGTEFRRGRRPRTGYLMPRRLRLSTEQVAAQIVALADRPRRMVVMPRIFWVAVVLNALAPGLLDRLASRAVRRLRPDVCARGTLKR